MKTPHFLYHSYFPWPSEVNINFIKRQQHIYSSSTPSRKMFDTMNSLFLNWSTFFTLSYKVCLFFQMFSKTSGVFLLSVLMSTEAPTFYPKSNPLPSTTLCSELDYFFNRHVGHPPPLGPYRISLNTRLLGRPPEYHLPNMSMSNLCRWRCVDTHRLRKINVVGKI